MVLTSIFYLWSAKELLKVAPAWEHGWWHRVGAMAFPNVSLNKNSSPNSWLAQKSAPFSFAQFFVLPHWTNLPSGLDLKGNTLPQLMFFLLPQLSHGLQAKLMCTQIRLFNHSLIKCASCMEVTALACSGWVTSMEEGAQFGNHSVAKIW